MLECDKVWNSQQKKKKKKDLNTWWKENINPGLTKEHKIWTNLWVSHSQSSQLYILSGFRKLVMI